jgi:glycosyltransferase involved in cell wall biosynthesis
MLDHTCISIIIPTYKRPEGLARALESIENETIDGMELEIIIADNDPQGSAGDFSADYIATSNHDIKYTHVPEPGVSNARNGGLSIARGRWVLFLDDDMTAKPPWASSMMAAAKQYEAALVFGPVTAIMPESDNPFFDHMQPLFSRPERAENGLIEKAIGTGNCLMDRGLLELPNPVFNPSMNQTGGEDDELFRKLEMQNPNIAWTNEAVTFEHVPEKRATLSYVWKRNFAFGQAPAQEAADRGFSGCPEIIKWMGVGFTQIGIYALLWVVSQLRRDPKAVHHYGRLAQGIGKLFWMERFAPKLYGN